MKLQLLALGEVDQDLLEDLEDRLSGEGGLEVERRGRAELVAADRDVARDRYRSSLVLHRLVEEPPPGGYLLALTAAEIYGGGWQFLFGHADAEARKALVSVARMGRAETAPAELRRRLLTESLHELGHLRELEHCDRPACAMNPFFTLYELDQRKPEYCERCSGLLQRA